MVITTSIWIWWHNVFWFPGLPHLWHRYQYRQTILEISNGHTTICAPKAKRLSTIGNSSPGRISESPDLSLLAPYFTFVVEEHGLENVISVKYAAEHAGLEVKVNTVIIARNSGYTAARWNRYVGTEPSCQQARDNSKNKWRFKGVETFVQQKFWTCNSLFLCRWNNMLLIISLSHALENKTSG